MLLYFIVDLICRFVLSGDEGVKLADLAPLLVHEILDTHISALNLATSSDHLDLLNELVELLALLINDFVFFLLSFLEGFSRRFLEPVLLGLDLGDFGVFGDLDEGVALVLLVDELVLPGVLVQLLLALSLSSSTSVSSLVVLLLLSFGLSFGLLFLFFGSLLGFLSLAFLLIGLLLVLFFALNSLSSSSAPSSLSGAFLGLLGLGFFFGGFGVGLVALFTEFRLFV